MCPRTMIRYEEKYLIHACQFDALKKVLSENMSYDRYSNEGQFYPIYNLYFDTEDDHVARLSAMHPKFKEKMRLRAYQCPVQSDDFVFLELKKKIDGHVLKRRISLTLKEATALIQDGEEPILVNEESKQVFREIEYYFRYHLVKPKVFLAYERLAYTSLSSLRITFDRHIRYRRDSLDFGFCEGKSLIQEGQYLLEIKSCENYPLWLVNALSQLEIHSQSFSKYGVSYQQYLTEVRS